MRKVTKEAVRSFVNGEKFKSGNTEVIVFGKEVVLRLHGNTIAMRIVGEKVFKISNAGWQSNTTKERLNALPNVIIQQKNYTWYLNSEAWNGKWTDIHF